jgi:hypothetical protein
MGRGCRNRRERSPLAERDSYAAVIELTLAGLDASSTYT